jgi:NAD(P)-dependent dehydrogenase (short-subunit alcohol dehydrogenase family)
VNATKRGSKLDLEARFVALRLRTEVGAPVTDALTKRVAVITGARSGMGRACVDRLRATADIILAVDIEAPDIEGTIGVGCDVSDPEAIQRVADRTRELGTFRALVHAAGISPTMGDARRILDVDLVGTQRLVDAFDPLVEAGSVAVCFSSAAAYAVAPFVDDSMEALVGDPLANGFLDQAVAIVGDDSGFAYALAKVGVIRAAARAAVRWGPRGGRVNSLAPGLIDTPMGRQEYEQQPMMRDMLTQTPIQRFGDPDEIAAVAAFLVSDEASFISGIDVLVDGGQLQGTKAATAGP